MSAVKQKNLKKTSSAKPKRWCVLFGFSRDDHSETGCLAFRSEAEIRAKPALGIYKIVDDISEAKHFPCENYDNAGGFATPEKWLEFFSEEPELKDWKFHLVKRSKFSSKKCQEDKCEDLEVAESKDKESEDSESCG